MAKRDLFIPAFLTLLSFIAANIAMATASRDLPGSRKISEISQVRNPNVLLVGNSTLDGRLNSWIFENAARIAGWRMVPVNAALAATQTTEQYLLFRKGMRHPGIDTVIVGFFGFQITVDEGNTVAPLLGYRSVAFDSRVDVHDAEFIYRFPAAERLRFRIFRMLPLFAWRAYAWGPVEKLRRAMDSASPEPENTAGYQKVLEFFTAHPTNLNWPMRNIVRESQARGARVIFLSMPMPPYYRAAFYSSPAWSRYVAALRGWTSAHGCGFIDGSDWFPGPGSFIDRLHLRFEMGPAFSAKLANAVVRDRAAASGVR
jgi:hypothetical protein